jgi:hypothetical protein
MGYILEFEGMLPQYALLFQRVAEKQDCGYCGVTYSANHSDGGCWGWPPLLK